MPAWNPWRALRGRDDVVFAREPLPPGCGGAVVGHDRELEVTVIVVDTDLDAAGRNSVVGHELVHIERGLLPANAPEWLVEKEERQVWDETARRLVPFEVLDEIHLRTSVSGEQVALWDLAKQLGVTEEVAERAVTLWAREQGMGGPVPDEEWWT